MAVANGTPLHAAAAGTVVTAGLSGGYGNLVTINSSGGYQTRYGHLSRIDVRPGEQVAAGQLIGLSGGIKGAYGSGDATGPHLHFEIRKNGIPIDPLPFLMSSANAGGSTSGDPGIGIPGVSSSGWASSLTGLTSIVGNLSNPKFWVRIGYFTLGVALLLIALTKIFSKTAAGNSVIQGTKSALKTAAIVAP